MRRLLLPLTMAFALALGGGAAGPAAHRVAAAAADDCRDFPQTGHQVCGALLAYWDAHGGLPQQGYPVSPLFTETSTADGHSYQVQYFERAVFERHPEHAPPDDVLLGQLGRDALAARYPRGLPALGGAAPPAPL